MIGWYILVGCLVGAFLIVGIFFGISSYYLVKAEETTTLLQEELRHKSIAHAFDKEVHEAYKRSQECGSLKKSPRLTRGDSFTFKKK